jgi:hypothetical protein
MRAAGARSDLKGAVVGGGDALGDGQAEAGTTGVPRAGVVEAGEAFEDPLVVFLRDAGAVVLDVENCFAVLCVVGQAHRDGAGRVAFGVVEQVAQDSGE